MQTTEIKITLDFRTLVNLYNHVVREKIPILTFSQNEFFSGNTL